MPDLFWNGYCNVQYPLWKIDLNLYPLPVYFRRKRCLNFIVLYSARPNKKLNKNENQCCYKFKWILPTNITAPYVNKYELARKNWKNMYSSACSGNVYPTVNYRLPWYPPYLSKNVHQLKNLFYKIFNLKMFQPVEFQKCLMGGCIKRLELHLLHTHPNEHIKNFF